MADILKNARKFGEGSGATKPMGGIVPVSGAGDHAAIPPMVPGQEVLAGADVVRGINKQMMSDRSNTSGRSKITPMKLPSGV